MKELVVKMTEDLKLRGYSASTCSDYVRCAKNFCKHFKRMPDELGKKEIVEYLDHLILERKVGIPTLKMNIASIKFLYQVSLGRPEEVAEIPWPKVVKPLPTLLTSTEVERLIQSVDSSQHRVILMVAYGTGIRVKEVCALQKNDIDEVRNLIHVREPKKGRERYVQVALQLMEMLKSYIKEQNGSQWLFPDNDGVQPVDVQTVRNSISKAAETLSQIKNVTPIILRYSFEEYFSNQSKAQQIDPLSVEAVA